nr:F-box protein [Cupriavidus gilardii]
MGAQRQLHGQQAQPHEGDCRLEKPQGQRRYLRSAIAIATARRALGPHRLVHRGLSPWRQPKMPFGTTLPLSHDSSALAPRRDSASGPQGGPSSPIRLDRLPDEVLLHIANDLDATSILALGESCTSVYVALWRDHVRPLQLEGRLRWTTTITDLHAVLSNLGQCCRDGRQRLLELGWVQSRHLHPSLQARAQRVLRAMTPPPSDDERLHQRLDAFLAVRSVTDDTQMPALLSLLEEIEHGDAASRGPLLVHWLAVAGGAGVMCRALDAWRATMSRLPHADAIALLVALLDASHGLEDPVRWNGTMQLAIDNAQTGADAQRWDQPWRADLLCAAARALAGPEIMAARTAGGMAGMPVALWQQLWGLLPRLAEPARVRLSVALAGSLATIDKLHLANPPRWSALIAHAGTLHGASATADVLEAIAGHIEDHGVKQQRPLVHALVAAAWPLPEPDRARVLVQVLFHTPEREVALLSSLWDRLYDISATAGSAVQSMILWALGRLVDATARGNGTRDERATRWLAVLERSKGLPEQEHRLHAMLGLISMNPLSSAGAAVDPDICLLQAGAGLADSDRANLLAILLAMGGRCATPASWRLAVKTASAALPGVCRPGAPVAGVRCAFRAVGA